MGHSVGGIGQDDFLADLVSGWTGRQLTAQLWACYVTLEYLIMWKK